MRDNLDKFSKVEFSGVLRRHVLRVVSYISRVDNIPDLVDEIETALDNNTAYLFTKGEDDDTFFILQPITVDDKPAVNVLFTYSPNSLAIKNYLPVIEVLAAGIGAVLLTGYTRHEKIFSMCESCGFERRGTTKQGLIEFHKSIV